MLQTPVASACIIREQEPEELKRQAEVVVQARIMKANAPRQTFRSVVYTYKVSIKSVERGSLALKSLEFTFEDLLIHRRGDLTVCPLKHGTGIENDLKPGNLYLIYLRSSVDTEILLAEEKLLPEPISRK